MKIGIDIRTLMDAQYSGVSEYALDLIRNISCRLHALRGAIMQDVFNAIKSGL